MPWKSRKPEDATGARSGRDYLRNVEIEEAIYEHEAISEVAVVAVPHRKYGDDIWAAVVFKPGAAASEDELRTHTAGFVTRFKIPSRFVAQAELPKNAVGKIMKREVAESLRRDP